jgi:hypothetical protein
VADTVWLALRRSTDTTPNSSEILRQIILKATPKRRSRTMVAGPERILRPEGDNRRASQ